MTTINGGFAGVASCVVVHKDHVGYVLGRKCTTINGVQKRTNTRVKWEDVSQQNASAPPMTRFAISGRSEKDVSDCFNEIMRLAGIADSSNPRAHLMPFKNVIAFVQVRGFETRCIVPASAVGMVLGKGGRKIDQISGSTSTWTKFFKENQERKEPACFSVRGFYESDVKSAVDRIGSIVDSSAMGGRPRDLKVSDVMSLKTVADVFTFDQPAQSGSDAHGIQSPTYTPSYLPPMSPKSPKSPTYAPDSPTYAPQSPHQSPE
jgi:predicted RNA-binding protein YlqC (UPF0109 family)